jgi:hypothetical protein
VASAMVNTAQQIGGSIGTAVFGSLAATQSRTISIPDAETTRAKQQNQKVANVTAAADDTSPLPAVPRTGAMPAGPDAGPREVVAAYTWQLPGRIRYGRPLRLVVRGAVAALLCLGVLAVIPGDPAAPPLVAALITWFVVTGRSDLAPPRHR